MLRGRWQKHVKCIYNILCERLGKSVAAQLNLLGIPWAREFDAELDEGVARRSYNSDGFAKTGDC